MIVDIAAAVREHVEQVYLLERAQDEAAAISETLKVLCDARQQAGRVSSWFRLIRDRVPSETAGRLAMEFGRIAELAALSREGFAGQRNQAASLGGVKQSLRQLASDIDTAWKTYIRARVMPVVESLKLVESLPEIREQLATLHSLRDQMQVFEAASPHTHEQLAQFDELAEQLETRLQSLKGMSPAIKDFLRAVLDQTATVADLTDEVLAWCRQVDRDTALRIIFAAQQEG